MPNNFQSKNSGRGILKDMYGGQKTRTLIEALLRRKRRKRARNRGMEIKEDE